MKSVNNCQWRVARHILPDELIGSEHFRWHEEPAPQPNDGEFLVRTLYLAPGPAQRAYIESRESPLFGETLNVGDVMRGRGIGQIVHSRHPDYREGEVFVGSLGWQEYSLQKPLGKEFIFSTRKIAKPVNPLSLHLGILGQAGGTAYFGLKEGGELKAGDNVLISAAAGGIGSVAGQLARIQGAASVVGIAGSDDKCAWLCDELGFSAAINYQREHLPERLAELFPAGIDLYLDSVGGEILDAALANIAMHGRVAIGGFISSQYAEKPAAGPEHYYNLLFKRATMRGFIYFDYWDRYEEAETALTGWYESGELINTETIYPGLRSMPEAVASLFTGDNRGIRICSVADAD
jgi:NADPH-dependent curcumin reductase CurA